MCGIQKNGADEPICREGMETQTETRDLRMQWGRGGEGGADGEKALTYTHPHVSDSWREALHSTWSSAWCSVMSPRGGGRGDGVSVHTQPIHLILQQELTQHCEAIVLQCFQKAIFKSSYIVPEFPCGYTNVSHVCFRWGGIHGLSFIT